MEAFIGKEVRILLILLSDVISGLTQGPTSIFISLFYSPSPSPSLTPPISTPHSTLLGLEMASRGCWWHQGPHQVACRPPGEHQLFLGGSLQTSGVHACLVFVTLWTVAHIYVFISFKSYYQHHSISAYENPTHPFKHHLTCYLPRELFLNLTV